MRGVRSFAAVAAIVAIQGANAQNGTTNAGTASASAAAIVEGSSPGQDSSSGVSSNDTSAVSQDQSENAGAPFVGPEGAFVFQNGSAVTNGQVADASRNNGSLTENIYIVQSDTLGVQTYPVYGIQPSPTPGQNPRITDLGQNNTRPFEVHYPNGTVGFINSNSTSMYNPHPRISDIPVNSTFFDFVNGTLNHPQPHPFYNNSSTTHHPNIIDIATGNVHPTYYQNATSTTAQNPRITEIGTGNHHPTANQNATSTRTFDSHITDVGTGNIPSVVYETLVQNATLVRTLNPLISDIMTGGAPMASQIVNGTFISRADELATLTQTIPGQNNGSAETRTLSNPRVTDIGTGIPEQGQTINGTILMGAATGDIPGSSEQATTTRSQNPLITDLVYNSTVVNPQTSYVTQVTERVANSANATITRGQEITTVITQSNGQPLTVVQTQSVNQPGQNFGSGSQVVEIPGQTSVQQQTLVSDNTIVRTQGPQASTVETRVVGGFTQSGGQVIGGSTIVETRPVSQQTQQASTVETRVVGGSTQSGGQVIGGSTVIETRPVSQQTQQALTAETRVVGGTIQSGGQVVGGTTIVESVPQTIRTQAVNTPMNPGASFSQAPFGNATAPAPVVAQTQPAPEITRTQEPVRQTTLSGGPVMEMTDGQIFEERTTAPPFIVQETPASTPFTTILGGTTLSSELVIPESTLLGGEIVPATTMRPGEVLSGTTAVIVPGPATEVLIGGTTMTEASFLPEQTLPNGEIIPATSLVPGDVVFQTTIPFLSSSPTPESQIDLPVTAPEIHQPAPSAGNGNPQSPAVGPAFENATEVAQPSSGSPLHETFPGAVATPQIPSSPQESLPAQPSSGSPLHETFPGAIATPQIPSSPQASLPAQPSSGSPLHETPQGAVATPQIPSSPQASLPAQPAQSAPVQPQAPFHNATIPAVEQVPPQGAPGVQVPGQAQPSAPFSNATVPSFGRPQENVVPSVPGQPIANLPSSGPIPVVPGQQTPQQPYGVAQPSGGLASQQPQPEKPIQNIPSSGTNPIVPTQAGSSESSPRPEIANKPSNGTQPVQGSPSASSPRPEQPIANPASDGTSPIPGQGSPSESSPRPEQPVVNPATNGTLPIPGVQNIQPEGYNPVMQLPDGQIQHRPMGGMPTSASNNSTQSPSVGGPGSVPVGESTQFSPSNNSTNIAETPGEVVPVESVSPVEGATSPQSTGSNRVPVEGGEEVAANPSGAPTSSSGSRLVKGAGSAFAAAVAMCVMAVV